MKVVKEKLRKIYGSVINFGKENTDLPHEDVIRFFASFLKPQVYVELGVYQCSLVNKLTPFVGKSIYAVDISADAGLFMKKTKKHHFFHGKTDDFLQYVKDNKITIDMIFIDADHRKESVLNDFKNFFPFVREDGIIFLHDGYPKNKEQTEDGYCSNCWEAIEELGRDRSEYEMVTLPLHPGLTICRKRTKQVPWIKR
jgi:hypothetical protein